jgi:hypothetical protein
MTLEIYIYMFFMWKIFIIKKLDIFFMIWRWNFSSIFPHSFSLSITFGFVSLSLYTLLSRFSSIHHLRSMAYDRKRSFNTAIVNDVRLRSYCCRVFPFQAAESWNRSRIIRPVRPGPARPYFSPVRSGPVGERPIQKMFQTGKNRPVFSGHLPLVKESGSKKHSSSYFLPVFC